MCKNDDVKWTAFVNWPDTGACKCCVQAIPTRAITFNAISGGLHCIVTTTTTTQSPVRIIVADTFNDRIMEWTLGRSAGVVVAGGNGQGDGLNQLNRPEGVSYVNGFYYIADKGNRRIVRYKQGTTEAEVLVPDGGRCFVAPDAPAPFCELEGPSAVEYDASKDELLITDSDTDCICKWKVGEHQGTLLAGGDLNTNDLSGQFTISDPVNAIYDTDGDIVFSNYGRHNILKWTPGKNTEEDPPVQLAGGFGVPESFLGEDDDHPLRLKSPSAIRIDGNGDYIIADTYNHRVLKLPRGATQATVLVGKSQSGGTIFPSAQSGGAISSSVPLSGLNAPNDVALDTFDRGLGMFISDRANHRVVQWAPGATEGVVVAGTWGTSGSANNKLNYPTRLALRIAA